MSERPELAAVGLPEPEPRLKRPRKPHKKRWVRVLQKEIILPDELLAPRIRVTIEVPWTWERERTKNRTL